MSALEDQLDIVVANAGWRESGSLSEARAYATALRKVIHLAPGYASSGAGIAVQLPISEYKEQLKAAEAFIDAQGGSTSSSSGAGAMVTHASLRNLRS